MLVLSRKIRESFLIGEVRVTIRRVRGDRVTLGIEAPQEVKVLRSEVAERDQLEQRAA